MRQMESQPVREKLSVLIVEPQFEVAECIAAQLHHLNATTVISEDSAQTIDALGRFTFSLVLFDEWLAGQLGPAAVRAIRDAAPNVPIVLMIGGDGTSKTLVDLRACAILRKPFALADITDVVGRFAASCPTRS